MPARADPQPPKETAAARRPVSLVRRPPPRLLDETPGLRLWHWPGETAATLVLFGPTWTGPTGEMDWWGRGMAAAVGWNTVAFAAKQPTWFPHDEVAALLPAALRAVTGPRATFGAAVGGYAALKHGRALAAAAALAIAPHPPWVPADGPLAARFREEQARAGTRVAPEDLALLPLLVFDPLLRGDRAQAERLRGLPGVRAVPLARTGRAVAASLLEAGLLRPLLTAALAGDDARAVAMLRALRRASPSLREGIAASLAQRGRAGWAEALRAAVAPAPPPPPWPGQAAAAGAAGDREREEALLRWWVAEAPLAAEPRLRLAACLRARGRPGDALVVLQSGIEAGIGDPALRAARAEAAAHLCHAGEPAAPDDTVPALRLGRALLEEEQFAQAAAVFAHITQGAPDCAEAWVGLSDAERSRRRIRPALDAYRRAVAAGADRATIRNLRFRLFGEYDG